MPKDVNKIESHMKLLYGFSQDPLLKDLPLSIAGRMAAVAAECEFDGYEQGREDAIKEIKELTDANSKMNEKKGRTSCVVLHQHETVLRVDVFKHLEKLAANYIGQQ